MLGEAILGVEGIFARAAPVVMELAVAGLEFVQALDEVGTEGFPAILACEASEACKFSMSKREAEKKNYRWLVLTHN